jgi:ribonuclease HI
MNKESNTVTIFTDGSSRGNPGPGGWAVIVHYDGKVQELGNSERLTTNNKMELTAALKALNFLESKKVAVQKIKIHTDSSYLIQGITKWVKGWIRNDWMTATKEPVSNQDIWQDLIAVVEKLEEQADLNWVHIQGHAGIPGNERCDEIATAMADDKDIELYSGSLENYKIDLSIISGKTIKKEVSLEKKERAKQKAYSYLSLVNGELQKHATWAQCEKRVKGVKGAKFKKSISKYDEEAIIKEWLGK